MLLICYNDNECKTMYLVQWMENDLDLVLVNYKLHIVQDEFYSTKIHIFHDLIHVELLCNFQVILQYPIKKNNEDFLV